MSEYEEKIRLTWEVEDPSVKVEQKMKSVNDRLKQQQPAPEQKPPEKAEPAKPTPREHAKERSERRVSDSRTVSKAIGDGRRFGMELAAMNRRVHAAMSMARISTELLNGSIFRSPLGLLRNLTVLSNQVGRMGAGPAIPRTRAWAPRDPNRELPPEEDERAMANRHLRSMPLAQKRKEIRDVYRQISGMVQSGTMIVPTSKGGDFAALVKTILRQQGFATGEVREDKRIGALHAEILPARGAMSGNIGKPPRKPPVVAGASDDDEEARKQRRTRASLRGRSVLGNFMESLSGRGRTVGQSYRTFSRLASSGGRLLGANASGMGLAKLAGSGIGAAVGAVGPWGLIAAAVIIGIKNMVAATKQLGAAGKQMVSAAFRGDAKGYIKGTLSAAGAGAKLTLGPVVGGIMDKFFQGVSSCTDALDNMVQTLGKFNPQVAAENARYQVQSVMYQIKMSQVTGSLMTAWIKLKETVLSLMERLAPILSIMASILKVIIDEFQLLLEWLVKLVDGFRILWHEILALSYLMVGDTKDAGKEFDTAVDIAAKMNGKRDDDDPAARWMRNAVGIGLGGVNAGPPNRVMPGPMGIGAAPVLNQVMPGVNHPLFVRPKAMPVPVQAPNPVRPNPAPVIPVQAQKPVAPNPAPPANPAANAPPAPPAPNIPTGADKPDPGEAELDKNDHGWRRWTNNNLDALANMLRAQKDKLDEKDPRVDLLMAELTAIARAKATNAPPPISNRASKTAAAMEDRLKVGTGSNGRLNRMLHPEDYTLPKDFVGAPTKDDPTGHGDTADKLVVRLQLRMEKAAQAYDDATDERSRAFWKHKTEEIEGELIDANKQARKAKGEARSETVTESRRGVYAGNESDGLKALRASEKKDDKHNLAQVGAQFALQFNTEVNLRNDRWVFEMSQQVSEKLLGSLRSAENESSMCAELGAAMVSVKEGC